MGRVDPNTSNVMGGYVAGHAVQAGAIHGGVHVHQAPAPSLPVPRQLPPPPASLVGREAEIAEIDRIVRRPADRPPIVVLSGVGGVGKSALALAWAHRAAQRYPDGHLYASLGAIGPADSGSLLAQMLRALGLAPERVPAEAGELGALFRSLTAGQRLLMLLDGATSPAQVRPLLPASPSTVVLVTARSRLGGLSGDGAAFLAVEPLTDESVVAFLAGAVGPERAASDPASMSALVRLCAGLPGALAIAAGHLAARPSWPVGRIVEELAYELQQPETVAGRHDDRVEGVAVDRRPGITMTATNAANIYQAAGDQYFIG